MRSFIKVIHPLCLFGHTFERLNRNTLYCITCGKVVRG